MISAVGDLALIDRFDELALAGPRGMVATFERERWGAGEQLSYGDVVAYASLADPPRLAVAKRAVVSRNGGIISERFVEILDPSTGETQRTVPVEARDLLGWDPTGAFLLARTRTTLDVISDDGGARSLRRSRDDAPLVRVAFAADGKSALLLERLDVVGTRLTRLDLAAAAVSWAAGVDATAMVVDADFTRAVVLEDWGDDVQAAALRDLGDGRHIADAIVIGARGEQLRTVWADRSIARIALLRADGTLRTFDATKRDAHWLLAHEHRFPVDTLVDVDRNFAFYAGDNGAILARLDGTTIAIAPHASRLCFAGTGVPVVVVVGAIHALLADDSTHAHASATSAKKSARFDLVEGSTNLVDIAPHPRGVIALDRDDCAHVIEVAR